MPITFWPSPTATTTTSIPWPFHSTLSLLLLLFLTSWIPYTLAMDPTHLTTLRASTRSLFWHGYTNYMTHAFPADELAPLTCGPKTRNRDNPADVGLNDVLGNYSVTLVDSLSTLAILASDEDVDEAGRALAEFQLGVERLVELYGNGTEGSCGSKACGFDLDSKVQVFETNIRGVGGLLSAHLFAVGELPIRGYSPNITLQDENGVEEGGILWPNNFTYTTQLLDLAHDLATRLLPAFSTATGLPYPRVNLRHGIPFYHDSSEAFCRLDGTSSAPRELTETCAAGAGSLVLEFTTLTRLTGDPQFERLAKRAFWAVWERRSSIGLIGSGLDAETGHWTMPPLAGIGAGADSFFEYALKSYILLSGSSPSSSEEEEDEADLFLQTWQQAHAAITHHIARPYPHPHYAQSDLQTGAPRYAWLDNLSAYYPGLLILAGELQEAISSHLLYAALWTRYSALPERWQVSGISTYHSQGSGSAGAGSQIDPNFRHWAGRPEFVESTWYLYQATKDPWYLYTGEMVLRDVRRRCWTRCGWAELRDVESGVQGDRMESFFLGETAKYLYLLFAPSHPLNTGSWWKGEAGGGWVFSTEGHPLVIPSKLRKPGSRTTTTTPTKQTKTTSTAPAAQPPPTCPAPPHVLPLTVSNIANRSDLFHAAALANLHLTPTNPSRASPLGPEISLQDVRSPTNYTFYPWTLPQSLIPPMGTSAPLNGPVVSTLTFPNLLAGLGGEGADGSTGGAGGLLGANAIPVGALQKVLEGVLINSLSNVRLSLVQEAKLASLPEGVGFGAEEFRVQGVANLALGRDEKVLVSGRALEGVSPADPHFTRHKDGEMVDLVLDVGVSGMGDEGEVDGGWVGEVEVEVDVDVEGWAGDANATMWETLDALFDRLTLSSFDTADAEDQHPHEQQQQQHQPSNQPLAASDGQPQPPPSPSQPQPQTQHTRHLLPAILPTGPGAAPLPSTLDHPDLLLLPTGSLPFHTSQILYLDSTLCTHRLPASFAKAFAILVIMRGECSFSDKLANIPALAEGLQLVIVLSTPESQSGTAGDRSQDGELIRPLLDKAQKTSNGSERRRPLAMVMVDGSLQNMEMLKAVAGKVGGFDGKGRFVESEREGRENGGGGGMGVKRRYWFESMGVPIGNLIML